MCSDMEPQSTLEKTLYTIDELTGPIAANAMVASENMDGLTGTLCQAIATELMQNEGFREELMGLIEEG